MPLLTNAPLILRAQVFTFQVTLWNGFIFLSCWLIVHFASEGYICGHPYTHWHCLYDCNVKNTTLSCFHRGEFGFDRGWIGGLLGSSFSIASAFASFWMVYASLKTRNIHRLFHLKVLSQFGLSGGFWAMFSLLWCLLLFDGGKSKTIQCYVAAVGCLFKRRIAVVPGFGFNIIFYSKRCFIICQDFQWHSAILIMLFPHSTCISWLGNKCFFSW